MFRRPLLNLLPYLARPLLFPFLQRGAFAHSECERRLWRRINRHELAAGVRVSTALRPMLRNKNCEQDFPEKMSFLPDSHGQQRAVRGESARESASR